MKLNLLLICTAGLAVACTTNEKSMKYPAIAVTYPETKKVEQTDDYHGTQVADPYRWLEIDTASEVESWVEAQNKATFGYLEQIPFRDAIKDRYTKLYDYPKLSAPRQIGEYFLFSKNSGLQNQSVIYIQKGLDGSPEVFVDPNTLSTDGTVTISLLGSSKDDKYIAISRAEAGSDWNQIRIMDLETKKELSQVNYTLQHVLHVVVDSYNIITCLAT